MQDETDVSELSKRVHSRQLTVVPYFATYCKMGTFPNATKGVGGPTGTYELEDA
jgi:hypothetical protein